MGRRPRTARRPRDDADRILDAALELAASDGWTRLTLGRIAAAAGVSLAELYRHYPSKPAVLAAFVARIDEAMAAPVGEALTEESARDRLFDVIMRRLDALAPHKQAVRAILRDARCDPVMLCAGQAPLRRSLAWMLDCAGLSGSGLFGVVRLKGLALIYLATLRVWLRDDSEDLGRTMAVLDRQLRGAEATIRAACALAGRTRRRAAETVEA